MLYACESGPLRTGKAAGALVRVKCMNSEWNKNEETLKGKINTTNYKFDDNGNVDEETGGSGGSGGAVGNAFALNGIIIYAELPHLWDS